MIKKLNIPWTAKALCAQISKGNIFFDCAIQRGYAWDNVRKSLLIHSMMQNYPVPAFFLAKREDGKYDCLDGKQRSNAISEFIAGNYTLCEDLDPCYDENKQEYDFSEHSFKDLPEWAQDNIKDFSLLVYYFEDLSEEEYDNIFFRLNNGKPLTSIELTRVKAKSLHKFQSMAQHDIVGLAVTDKGKIRYNHENLVMQAWAICFVEDVSFETKVFRNIIETADVDDHQFDAMMSCFDDVLFIYNSLDLTNRKEKRIAKRIITRTHLVALTKVIMVAKQKEYDVKMLAEWVKMFFDGAKNASIDADYNAASGSGSARKDKVDTRMNAVLNSMEKFIAGPSQSVIHDEDESVDVKNDEAPFLEHTDNDADTEDENNF